MKNIRLIARSIAVPISMVLLLVSSGSVHAQVIPPSVTPVLTAVTITQLPPVGVQAGQHWQLAVTTLDQNGAAFSSFPSPTIGWTSSNTAVAIINATGYLTAVAPGTTIITANAGGGISGTATVTVTGATQILGSIVITSSPTGGIAVGSTFQYAATVLDNTGVAFSPQPTVNWQSSNPVVATISASGLATAITPGTVTIFASYGWAIAPGSAFTSSVPVGTFSLTASAGAGGTISPLGYTGVLSGASQTYTITPNTGYNIADVLIDGVSVGAVTTYTFTNVLVAHTISASFSIIPAVTYNIVSSAGVNGTITPTGTTAVVTGASQTYTITSATGYSVASVLVDGVSVGAVTTYTFTGVVAAHTISATFSVTPVVLTTLVTGWNLIGWTGVPTTADAFGLANTGVDVVSKWDAATQLWVSHIINFPLNNFTINTGDGLFVHKI